MTRYNLLEYNERKRKRISNELGSEILETSNYIEVSDISKNSDVSETLQNLEILEASNNIEVSDISQNLHVLETSQDSEVYKTSQNIDNHFSCTGKRIIDVVQFIKNLVNAIDHGPFGCGLKNLQLVNEKHIGLDSIFF